MTFNFNNITQAFGLNDTPLSYIYGSGDYLLWPVEQTPPTPPDPDYVSQYLTLEFLESGTFGWNTSWPHNNDAVIYYSLNGGEWITQQYSITINVNQGDKVRLKGDNQYIYLTGTWFIVTAKFNVYGNVMSLLYLDSFSTNNVLPTSYTFGWLFYQLPVVSAENLVLPATTLTDYCYIRLFEGCQYLQVGPKLNAQTLATGCYARMFADCPSINRITCKATNISASNCLVEWVKNVGAGGVFTKKTGVSWPSGDSGIPTGWTVVNAS